MLLLEVLIAFSLVLLCAFPLLRSEMQLLRRSLEMNRALQMELHARNAYAEVVRRFLMHEIQWKEFSKAIELEVPGSWVVRLPKGVEEYSCLAKVSIDATYQKNKRADIRLLDVALSFHTDGRADATYDYQLCTVRWRKEDQPSVY